MIFPFDSIPDCPTFSVFFLSCVCDSVRGSKGGADYTPWGRGEKEGEAGGGEPNIDSQIEVASICPFSRNEGKGKRAGAEVKGKIFFLAARRLARGQRERKKAGLVSLDGLPGDLCRGEREISR